MTVLTTREANMKSAALFLCVASALVVVATGLEMVWGRIFGVRATGFPIVPGIVSAVS
jgi:ABC-type nickel/cobalt efflux system permease component RcnA